MSRALFDHVIGIYQVLLHKARVDLEPIVMKKYITFTKTLGLEPHHLIIVYHIQDTAILDENHKQQRN